MIYTPYVDAVTMSTVDGATVFQGTVRWQDQVQHTTACYSSAWEAQDACLDWMDAQGTEEAAWQETFGNPSAAYWR